MKNNLEIMLSIKILTHCQKFYKVDTLASDHCLGNEILLFDVEQSSGIKYVLSSLPFIFTPQIFFAV